MASLPQVSVMDSNRQLQIVRKIKTLLGLEFLLKFSLRVAMVTALLSAISFRLIPEGSRSHISVGAGGHHEIGDLAFILWLALSTALFFPCAALVDLALCAAISPQIVILSSEELAANWTSSAPPVVYFYLLSCCVEFPALLLVGFLRILGLTLAVIETYLYTRGSPNLSLKKAYFNLIAKSQYDWWTLRPLPMDFVSGAWNKRLCRPWLPPRLQASSPQALSQETTPTPPSQAYEEVTPYLTMFFGAQTFRTRRGERLWFVIFRGIIAMACLAALIVYSANVLFLQPNDESGAPPIQIQRISTLPIGTKMSTPTWGVVVGIDTRYIRPPSGTDLDNLISVTAELQVAPEGLDTCSSTVVPANIDDTWRTYQLISYQCATLWLDGPRIYTPQIHVQTDYAAWNVFHSNFTPEGSVMVWPSFTNNIRNILGSTEPTSLMIGNSVIASVDGTIRASFTAPMKATFGFASNQEMYIVGQIAMLGADPFMTGADPPQSDGIASIRLIKAIRTTDWELYSDTRQHTVLVGLSALGGLSVFLNSVFIILFGGSLMLVLFDVKPLSVFGLLHSFSKTTLSQRLNEDFPRLHDEGGRPGDPNSGLVAFIREYMLDLAPLPSEAKRGDGELSSQATRLSLHRSTASNEADRQSKEAPDTPSPSQPVRSFFQELWGTPGAMLAAIRSPI